MKKRLLSVLLLCTLLLSFNLNVSAKSSLYKADEKLFLDENFNGTVFFAGEKISSEGDINGIGFMAGNEVSVDGNMEYGFIAGETLNITSNIKNDLFLAGSDVNLTDDAVINRDLFVGAANITINNVTVKRNANLAASVIEISNTKIEGNLYISAEEIVMGENVVIDGKLSYNENAIVTGISKVDVDKIKKYALPELEKVSITTTIRTRLLSIISQFLLLVIIFLLFPSLIKKIDKKIENNSISNYLTKMGIGFIALVMVPIASVIMMVTIIGLPIGFLLLALYCMSLYFSLLVTSYIIGNKINTYLLKKPYNYYSSILIGIILMKVISFIPVISGLVSFFGLLLGIGVIVNLFIKERN